MLLTREQGRHLEKDGERFKFVDDGTVTQEDRARLRRLDESTLSLYGYHLITNYKELNKKG